MIRLGALAITVALAGCSAQTVAARHDPPRPTAAAPRPTPSSIGTMPTGITDPRERAAYQTVLDFYAAENTALDTLDTRALERLTTPTCVCRTSRLQQVATLRKHGEHMRAGGYENLRVDGYLAAGTDRAVVTSQESITPGDVVTACGTVVEHQEHFVGEYLSYVLRWNGTRWLVDSDDLIREAHEATTGEYPTNPGTAPTGAPPSESCQR